MKLITKILLIGISLTLTVLPSAAQKRKSGRKAVVKVDPVQKKYEQYLEMPIMKAMFTDSIRIKMSELSEKVILPEHVGRLILTDGNFGYENEFAGIRLITRKNDKGLRRIYQQMHIGNDWSAPTEVVIDEDFEELSSPWLMPDGQTLYFAARGEGGEKTDSTFNLYTSMLNTSTREFMKPQKLPMPLNHDSSDDLYYIENDIDNIAYFVTSRHQDNGFVTLYTLKPNQPWEYYSNDELGRDELVRLAELSTFSDTWTSAEERQSEKQRLKSLANLYAPKTSKTVLITLADGREITDASQMTTATGKALLRRYLELRESIADSERQLEEYRIMYHNSKPSAREPLAKTILSLESSRQDQSVQLRSITNELMTAK